MKFLIDECLSPELVLLAHEHGYGESSHVVWMGLGGWKDWELKPHHPRQRLDLCHAERRRFPGTEKQAGIQGTICEGRSIGFIIGTGDG